MKKELSVFLAMVLGLAGCENIQFDTIQNQPKSIKKEEISVTPQNVFFGQDNFVYFNAYFSGKEEGSIRYKGNSKIYCGKLEELAEGKKEVGKAEQLIDLHEQARGYVSYIDSLVASENAAVAGRETNFYFVSVNKSEKGLEGKLVYEANAKELLKDFEKDVYAPSLRFYDYDSSGFYATAGELSEHPSRKVNFKFSLDGKKIERLYSLPENIQKRQEALSYINKKLEGEGRKRIQYAGQIRAIDGKMYALYPSQDKGNYTFAVPIDLEKEKYDEISGYFKGGENEK